MNQDTWSEFERGPSSPKPGQYVGGFCGLCANWGYINISGLKTPAGVLLAPIVQRPCICPNGRVIKYQLDQHAKKAKALDTVPPA